MLEYFVDTFCVVSISYDGVVFFVCCLLFAVAKAAGIGMDPTALFFVCHFLQLHGFNTHTVHHNYRGFPKKGATN